MNYRVYGIALALSVLALGCDESPTSPSSDLNPRFTATLTPANEVPPVTNAESSGSGTVTITMHLTKDSAGTVTAATADFQVSLTGFPANTTLTGAHIHPGAAGTNGGIVWSTTLANGELVLATGAGSFTKSAIAPASIDTAQAIVNNPAGFYFNVHSPLNGGGFARGQLVRAN